MTRPHRHVGRIAASVVVLLAVVLGGLWAPRPALAAPGTLSVTITAVDMLTGDPQTTAAYGTHNNGVAYRIEFACSAGDCFDAEIAMSAPQADPYGLAQTLADTYGPNLKTTLLQYGSWTPPAGMPGASISGNDTTGMTVSLGDLGPGRSGNFLVVYRIPVQSQAGTLPAPAQFYPDGFDIETTATGTATDVPAASGTSHVTWNIEVPDPLVSVVAPTSVEAGTDVTYSLRMGSSALRGSPGSPVPTGNGSLLGFSRWVAAGNYTVTYELPPEAEFVSAGDGGMYDAAAHTVTWSLGSSASPEFWAAGGWGSYWHLGWIQRAPWYAPRQLVLNYPASAFPDADENGCNFRADVTGRMTTSVTYLDAARTTKTAEATNTLQVACADPFGRAGVVKDAANNFTTPDGVRNVYVPEPGDPALGYYWRVWARNGGNRAAVATITDDTLDQDHARVHRIQVPAGSIVEYTLNDGTAGTATGTVDAPAGTWFATTRITTAPIAPPNVLPSDSGWSDVEVRFHFTVDSTAPVGETRTNTASVVLTYPDEPELDGQEFAAGPAGRTIRFAKPSARFEASFAGPPVVEGGSNAVPGTPVTFNLRGETGQVPAGVDITPQYVFIAPVGWDVITDSASFAAGSVPAGVTFTYTTKTIAGQERDVVVATWPDTVTFGRNTTWPTMSVGATPTFAVPAGTQSVAHAWIADSGNPWPTGTATFVGGTADAPDVDGDADSAEMFATAGSSAVLVSSADGLTVVKEVCRPDPDAADGCDWVSDPGSLVPVSTTASDITYRVTIINTGNTSIGGVVAYDVLPFVGDGRGSTFAETLASTSNVSANAALAFSNSTNPCRPEIGPAPGCVDDWGAAAAGSRAIRATVTGTLAPGGSASFTYAADAGGAPADARACNSVAVDSNRTLPAEPLPVCATTQEADLEITVPDRLPLQVGRAGVVPFAVTNLGGSAEAPAAVSVDIPAGLTVLDLEPAGWDCTSTPSGVAPIPGPLTLDCAPVDAAGDPRLLALDDVEALEIAVTPTSGESLCVPAEVTSEYHDPNLANNTSSGCMAIAAAPDGALDVDKDDGLDTVAPGDEITYTITVDNPLVAESVSGAVVTDELPANVTFVSATGGGTVSGQNPDGTGGTVTWNLADLAPAGVPNPDGSGTSGGTGSSQSVSVTVTVAGTASGDVTNEADVSAPDPADQAAMLTGSDTDVDVVAVASLSVVKATTTTEATAAGQVIPYTFTVTNDGELSIDDVSITDPLLDAAAVCAPLSIAPTEVSTCTGEHTLTQAEIDAGDDIVNTATVTGTPTGSDTSIDPVPSNEVIVPVTQSPSLAIVKATTATDLPAAGEAIPYTFTVTNDGNVTMSDVTVTDPNATGVQCPDTTLDPLESVQCTGEHTVTVDDWDTGSVVNTATVTGTPPGSETPIDPVSSNTVTVPGVQAPSLSIDKATSASEATAAGQVIPYSFTVTNDGNVTISDVTVADPLLDAAATCAPLSIAPGEVSTCSGEHTVTQAEIDAGDDIVNTATVTGTPPGSETPIDPVSSNTVTVPVTQDPSLSIDKATSASEATAAGQVIPYSFTVTNDGNVTISDVTVADPLLDAAATCAPLSIAPGEVSTCSGEHTVTQAEIDAGDDIVNTATVTGTPPGSETPIDPVSSDTVTVPVTQSASLLLDKGASQSSYDSAGDVVDYTFTVTNTGTVTLSGVVINDILLDAPATCPVASLAPAASMDCTGSHTITGADVTAGAIVNVATAAAAAPDGSPRQSPPASVTVPYTPAPVAAVANDNAVLSAFNTPVTIDVLDNDFPGDAPLDPQCVRLVDSEGDPVTELTVVGEGRYVVNDDGTVTFTPVEGFSGDATPVAYTVCDLAGDVVGAMIRISIAPECSVAAASTTSSSTVPTTTTTEPASTTSTPTTTSPSTTSPTSTSPPTSTEPPSTTSAPGPTTPTTVAPVPTVPIVAPSEPGAQGFAGRSRPLAAPTTMAPGCPPATPPTTQPPAPPPTTRPNGGVSGSGGGGGSLPATGHDATPFGTVALGLLGLGIGVVAISRRRRPA